MSRATAISAALAAALTMSAAGAAESGDWRVRTGPIGIFPNDGSESVLGGNVGVDSAGSLGLTVGHMVTDRVGLEVLLSAPVSHDLEGRDGLSGLGDIGEVDQLPPTFSLQYHPRLERLGVEWVEPYVGVGLNYTMFFDEDTSPSLANALGDPQTDIDVDDSLGFAGQVGADWPITRRLSVNTTLWYIDMGTEAHIHAGGSTTTADVDVDPLVAMVGATFRF